MNDKLFYIQMLWDAVQAQLQAGAAKPRRRTTKGRAALSPLAGKLFDETGDRLTPSHTKKKNGQRLRYYVSRRLIPSCAKTRPSRHRRKNCASRNQAKTLAREQVTRRPPTLDCGSTIWTRRERKRSRFYLNIGVARVTAFRVPHTATTADR